MRERPIYVLLIPGYDWSHHKNIHHLYEFLNEIPRIPFHRIHNIANEDNRITAVESIEKFFMSLPRATTVDVAVMYIGHGNYGIFSPNGITLGYNKFVRYFGDLSGDFIFVNDSCHSGSCMQFFNREGLLPDRGQVIASARESEKSYSDHFYRSFLSSLINRKRYKKRVVGRYVRSGSYEAEKWYTKNQASPIPRRKNKPTVNLDTSQLVIKPQTDWVLIEQSHPRVMGKPLEHLLFPEGST